MHLLRIAILCTLLIASTTAFAHSGKTDASGCHTNKKTGDYHCHGTKTPKVAKTEARSVAPVLVKTAARSAAPKGKQALTCTTNIYNCSDFSTQKLAQATFEHCMQTVGSDVHDLDRDTDNIACENNR